MQLPNDLVVEVPVGVLVAVIGKLKTRPYEEVADVIAPLQALTQAAAAKAEAAKLAAQKAEEDAKKNPPAPEN